MEESIVGINSHGKSTIKKLINLGRWSCYLPVMTWVAVPAERWSFLVAQD